MEKQWKCDTHIIFDSFAFKLHVLEIIIMGFISLILSYNPDFLAGFESLVRSILRYTFFKVYFNYSKSSNLEVKFIYSEKATKLCEMFT